MQMRAVIMIAVCGVMLGSGAFGQSNAAEPKKTVSITGRVVDPLKLPLSHRQP